MKVHELQDALQNFELDDEVVIGSEFAALPIKEVSQYATGTVNIEVDDQVHTGDLFLEPISKRRL